jgi:hypothetical protein
VEGLNFTRFKGDNRQGHKEKKMKAQKSQLYKYNKEWRYVKAYAVKKRI